MRQGDRRPHRGNRLRPGGLRGAPGLRALGPVRGDAASGAAGRAVGSVAPISMKLAMTLLVRNEEDILEANLDFHLSRGVDFVIAIDNNSEDDTGRILDAYASKGSVH